MHIGLADFAEPTLLILGDAVSLNWLADGLEARRSIDLSASPFVKLVRVELVIEPSDDEGSLSRNGALFKWKISTLEVQQFAEQLRALAVSKKPAHAYLDPKKNGADVQLIASKAEYGSDAVFI